MSDESMEYDVVIVGAGPSGLAAAIKFKQIAIEKNQDFSVCVLEKGSEVGAHIISGAVIETRDNTISYWALKHPMNTPDFHHRESFNLRINPFN